MKLPSVFRDDQEGWVLDTFQTTPLMSTYLLMLVVSPLSYINITAHRQDLTIRGKARFHDIGFHDSQVQREVIFSFCLFVCQYVHISCSGGCICDLLSVPLVINVLKLWRIR